MKSNANSVNIKNYHHGDLASAVVAEGLRLLQDREADALSLREIARNVGVSATALYRHFPDKASLLSALAGAGYAQLAHEQRMALKNSGQDTGADGFADLGRAYVRFAMANPALFRLIFVGNSANLHAYSPAPEGSAASLLEQGVAHMMGEGISCEARYAVMLRAWSLVHGLSMLILDKQVVADDALIDQVISATSLGFEVPSA